MLVKLNSSFLGALTDACQILSPTELWTVLNSHLGQGPPLDVGEMEVWFGF